VKKKLKDALHRYKVESFKLTHHGLDMAEVNKEILDATQVALQNSYRLHFEKNASPQSIETFTMVKTFVTEALLPPVMEKVMRRITAVEKQQAQMVALLGELMEALSEEDAAAAR
jgi:hypothetical protein